MKPKKVIGLIVKYITSSISSEELDQLEIELLKPSNTLLFNEYIRLNYSIDRKMKSYDTEKSKRLLLDKIKKDKSNLKRFKYRGVLKYAAIIIFSITLGYFVNENLSKKSQYRAFTPKENFITLEREDGNIQIISEDGTSEVMDSEGNVVGSQVGNQLVYTNASKAGSREPMYNTLHVPYGKHFELKLSDGSIAYLNSGSSLKYPVDFITGKERRVYLSGEAFLDVAKDTERPFIVNAADLNIRVFGTKFNISAYPEDPLKEVVLVEGSVGMYPGKEMSDDSEGTMLVPGHKGSYDNVHGNINTEPVVTSIYTSWVNGVMVFRNMTFENILKKLERHYDVKIVNNNGKLASAKFNASFGEMPIHKILDYFKAEYHIDYSVINDHEIIVN
ncbi:MULTISPECIES: FecR family protein [unclassified Arenibacter]|uniref:FecR family protein n=1 Tax=unclassified Arenibacter TaxID=2615047 RepID=UPI000E356516|nr:MULTISPECIES: FecR domain-containing protein [unclassified Arenibacter]MCM4165548.1 iron dicitrate transport regulator FecR [Arenibacter sp. A80]RFT54703.1 FecR family protein [Arenibacter sp. P308M17]